MKLFTKYLLILLAGLLVISCSDDDDDSNPIDNGGNGGNNGNVEGTIFNIEVTGDINRSFEFDNSSFEIILNTPAYSSVNAVAYDDASEEIGIDLGIMDNNSLEENKTYNIFTEEELESEESIFGASIVFYYFDDPNAYRFDSNGGSLTITEVSGNDYLKGNFELSATSGLENLQVDITGTFVVDTK